VPAVLLIVPSLLGGRWVGTWTRTCVPCAACMDGAGMAPFTGCAWWIFAALPCPHSALPARFSAAGLSAYAFCWGPFSWMPGAALHSLAHSALHALPAHAVGETVPAARSAYGGF